MDIPDELIASVARSDAVLFIGAGLSMGAGLPGWKELIAPLADRIGLPEHLRGDLLKVAQHYEGQRGRHALISYIKEQTDTSGKPTTENYRRLLRLGIRTWVTTNFDDLAEQALREARMRFKTVVRDSDLPYASADQLTLLKLHGDSEQPDTIVITQQDYSTYFRRFPRVKEKLSGLLVEKTFLFVGYSISDPDFNQIQAEIGLDLQQHQRMAYAVFFDADAFTLAELRSRNIQVLNITAGPPADRSEQLGALLDQLIHRVDQARQPAPSLQPPVAGTRQPPVAAQPAGTESAAVLQDDYTYDAFISYNQKDSDWVETVLQPRLERAGLRLCLPDRDFEIGAARIVNMENAVARSRKTLLILTPNWGDSQWSEFEGLLVQSSDPIGARRRVLPLIVRPSPLPARLSYLTPLDLTNAAKFERQMQRLVDAIRADPGGASAPSATSSNQGSTSRDQSAPPESIPVPSGGDGRLDYERGLRVLGQYVSADDDSDWRDFELYKGQLLSNLSDERRFGSTETLRSDRSRVIDKLNPLALRLTKLSFTDLCLGKTLAR